MEKIKCLLVDDENKVLQSLIYVILNHIPELEIVGTATGVETAYELINLHKPDVVFLDIVMPVHSGFELIKRFEQINFEIVFITSHQEYALEAIRCLALAYLLKPVDVDDLKEVVVLLKERLELKQKKELYEALLYNMSKTDIREHKLAVYNHDRTELIEIKDIIRLEGWNRYTRIITKSKKTYVSSYNLGRYASLLEKHAFFLSHKSHLINLDHVVALQADATIEMIDASFVPLAVRKRQEFSDLFHKVRKLSK